MSTDSHRLWQNANLWVALLLGLAAWHLIAFTWVMLPSSLWVDEIISIRDFSGQGLIASLTQYPEPNNHIFFNALRAVLPFASTYDPVLSRLFSLLVFFIGCGVLLHLGGREKNLPAAALVLLIIVLSDSLLGTLWQVRGYGLQFLLFCLALWSLQAYARDRRPRDQILLGTWAVLSVWTATSALLFWLPFFSVLVLAERRKSWWILLGGIVLTSIFLHLPVLRDFIRVYLHYGEDHGKFFEGWNGVRLVAAQWFSIASGWLLLGLLAGAFVLQGIGWKKCSGDRTAFRYSLYGLVGIAGSLFLGYLAETPPSRVYAPFLVFLLWPLVNQIQPLGTRFPIIAKGIWPTLALGAVLLSLPTFFQGKTHLPFENWKGSADWIELVFRGETPVHATFRPHLLAIYLHPERTVAKDFDPEAFRTGDLIVVDSEVDGPRHEERFRRFGARTIQIPQLRNWHQSIHFVPQRISAEVTVVALPPAPGFAQSARVTIDFTDREIPHALGWESRDHTILRDITLEIPNQDVTTLPISQVLSHPPIHLLLLDPETQRLTLEFDLVYAQSQRLQEIFWSIR